MNLNKFNNRDDIKWSHPEIVEAYRQAAESIGFCDTIYNEDISFEERQEFCRKYCESFAEFCPEYDRERTFEYAVPGCLEEKMAPPVKMNISYPKGSKKKKMPCIIMIPGGGLAMCMTLSAPIEAMSDDYRCVAATFEYRTCLDGGGYPQTVNDCHAVYQYIYDHAEELRVDPDKIILFGASSGGHLALALCHRLKRYNYTPRGCIVYAPVIDDRTIYPSSKIVSPSWAGEQVYVSSKCWLGKKANPAFVPAEAFPNHASAEECVGLPPTFIHTFTNDACADPCLIYASKLSQAGVYVGLHMWEGSNHDALTTADMIYQGDEDVKYPGVFAKVVENEFRDCIQYDLRRPWTVEESNSDM